jgi:hypothetical protein
VYGQDLILPMILLHHFADLQLKTLKADLKLSDISAHAEDSRKRINENNLCYFVCI